MTIHRYFNKDHDLVVIRYGGKLVYQDFADNIKALSSLILSSESIRSIVIFAEDADFAGLSAKEWIDLSSNAPLLNTKQLNVAVAANPVSYGMSRMFAAYSAADKGGVEVFKTIDEACKRLNINLDQISSAQELA